MLVVSRFILRVFMCMFFSLFCLYMSLCLCFLLCYAVNKDLYIGAQMRMADEVKTVRYIACAWVPIISSAVCEISASCWLRGLRRASLLI